jgi:lipid-binding SYLF domain-containing protein
MNQIRILLQRRATVTVLAAALCAAVVGAAAPAAAASREETDAHVREAVQELYRTSPAARELAAKASAMLVFPSIIKAGFGIGGEYGEGALLIGGQNSGYYNIASASVGLQLGVQEKSVAILFMTADSLARFRESKGWKAGVDGSVAIATLGAGKALDTETASKPIIGFVFSNKGLMYNLTIEGSKITRMEK